MISPLPSVNRSLNGIRFVAIVCAVALTLLIAEAPIAAAAGSEDVSIRVCGLRVVDEGHGGSAEEGKRAFNRFKGTTLALLIESKGAQLIGFDDEASKIESFTDDKGTDLFVAGPYVQPGFGGWPDFTEDRKAAIIELDGAGVPAKGAQALKAKGTLAFSVASKKESFKQEGVTVEKGSAIKAGPIAFTISEVGAPEWGDNPLRITLKAEEDTGKMAGIRFLDAEGNEIESSESGSTSMTINNATTVETYYDLAKKADSLTVEVSYWMDMKTMEVPFDVTATVGL